MHRAGTWVADGRGVGPAGDRAEVQQAVVVGFVGSDLAEPAHRFAVELELVDRLARTDVAELRRAVGGEHDQRHARLVGLDDGGVEVRRGRSRGAEHGGGDACGERRAQGEETRRCARPGSPPPRSPAAARGRRRAESTASRARSPPGERRCGPAPPSGRRRGRCCGWSSPPRRTLDQSSRRDARASSSISTPRPGRSSRRSSSPSAAAPRPTVAEKSRSVARPCATPASPPRARRACTA